jgi:hypothetical protein
MKIVKCVKKGSEIKVAVVGEEGFVQFPKDIRVEGKMFAVEELEKKGSFWKAKGAIYELVPVGSPSKSKTQPVQAKESKNDYYEFVETNDHEGEEWSFFIKKDLPLVKEFLEAVASFKKLTEYGDSYDPDSFKLNKSISKEKIEVLMKRKSKSTYMNDYNLVKKILHPKAVDEKYKSFSDLKTVEDLSDYFYKGGCFETR